MVTARGATTYSAESQFTIENTSKYTFKTSGETEVVQNITLTNTKDDSVATGYRQTFKNMQVTDATATVNNKSVAVRKEVTKEDTQLSLVVENSAIGKGRKNNITLTFYTKDLVSKTGKVWNISVPRAENSESVTSHTTVISIPKKYGPKIFISPTPILETEEEEATLYYFESNIIKNESISGAFGEYQQLNFRIRYQLENKSLFSAKMTVALPPEKDNYQRLKYTSLKPTPKKIYLDDDGNVLADFVLKPRQKLEVELLGNAVVYGKQINVSEGGKFSALPKDLIKNYTKSKEFWPSDKPEVKEIAKALKNPDQNVSENARNIYLYVVNNLEYDFDAIKRGGVARAGGEVALTQKGSWTCMEFTDSFISIARAQGIPAREINGYAFTETQNKKPLSLSLKGGDLLHAWPEYYDPNFGWVQIDPTWGKTSDIDYFSKLDTNHFTLSVKGLDDEKPYPAGSYRFNDTSQLVEVDFSDASEINFDINISLDSQISWNIFKALGGKKSYKVVNKGGTFVKTSSGLVFPPFSVTSVYLSSDDAKGLKT